MPTTYTHYCFGKDTLNLLEDYKKEIVNRNIDLFNIGLHGPDILFYYRPYKKNSIISTGNSIHEEKGLVFFNNALNIIKSAKNLDIQNQYLSYIYGFICHFALDCEAHKYIEKKIDSSNVSHYEIEAELDRFMLIKNNLNPITTRLTNHIKANKDNSKIISEFFNNINSKKIYISLKSMIRILNILIAPSKIKRNMIFACLDISNNKELKDLIIKYKSINECIDSNTILFEIYKKRQSKAISLINNFTNCLNNNDNLDFEFNRTFLS